MYDKKQKATVGHSDKEPVSRQYQNWINNAKKTLHKNMTPAERVFDQKIGTLIAEEAHTKYRRQKEIYIAGNIAFILDFYFPNFRVAVEVDGGSHYGKKAKEKDAWRDAVLLEYAGISTIRFTNSDITKRTNESFNRLIRFLAIQKRATPSSVRYLIKTYRDIIPEP